MTEHDSPITSDGVLLDETQVREAAAAASPVAGPFIQRGTREFFWANVALFAAGFATFALLYCVQPLMPLFSAEFNLSPARASLAMSVTTQALAGAILVAGSLSEVFGRKRVMAISMTSAAVLLMASAFAPSWGWFLVLRFLAGLAFSGVPATAMAYIGEEMHADVSGMAMGLYIGGTGLGALGGRLVVSVMADYIGWRTGLFVLGLLSLAAGTLFWLRLPASRHFVPHRLHLFSLLSSATSHLKDPVLLGLYMQGFLLLGAYMAFYNYLGYRLMGSPYGFTQAAIGLIFLITLAGSFTAGWTAHLATRLGRSVSFCFLVVLMLAGVVISLASPLWLIIAGAAVMTFAFYGAHSVASGWVSIRASRGKSQAASFYLFSYYTGSSLIGWAGGHAWSAAGWPGVVATIGAGLFVALLVAFSLHVAARCGQKSSIMDF